jgi:hypothetical protein
MTIHFDKLRRHGHARRRRHEPLTHTEREALARAAARRGAWTSRSVMHSATLETLLARGFVRRLGALPGDLELFEITPEGRRVLEEPKR